MLAPNTETASDDRRQPDGSIDYGRYKREAEALRKAMFHKLAGSAFRAVKAGAGFVSRRIETLLEAWIIASYAELQCTHSNPGGSDATDRRFYIWTFGLHDIPRRVSVRDRLCRRAAGAEGH